VTIYRLAITLSLLVCACSPVVAQVDVLTQHNDNARTGANLRETELTPANVNGSRFGMLFRRSLDDQPYGQPLLATNIAVGGGTHDIVYVTTVNNSVYAFDANDTEALTPYWHVNFGTPANLHSANFGCLDMTGQVGIIGTPVIDKDRHVLYVVALTQAGSGFTQRLHELDLATGGDLPESPVVIKAEGFDGLMQSQRPALLLANGMVYVSYASHCDRQPYHGYLMAYDAKTLSQVGVFNTSPTGSGASIWQSGQGPSADSEGNVYAISGNGSWDGEKNFSESFLKFSPQLKLLDWFTPTNHFALDKSDTDLNSAGATLIPGTHLVLGGGKDGVMYVLDTRHFGQLGDEHALQRFKATTAHLHSLVYWASDKSGGQLFVWGPRDKVEVFGFSGDKLGEQPKATRDEVATGFPGAMLSLSANGGKDGILWAAIHASGDAWHESPPGVLHAFDADDIRHELWNSLELPQRDDCGRYSKMAPATIANGKVYLGSFGSQNAGSGQLCVYGLLPSVSAAKVDAPVGGKAEVRAGSVLLTWDAVAGAKSYRVVRTSTEKPETRVPGLTSPNFTEPGPAIGETYQYTIYAIGTNGVSAASEAISLTGVRPPRQ